MTCFLSLFFANIPKRDYLELTGELIRAEMLASREALVSKTDASQAKCENRYNIFLDGFILISLRFLKFPPYRDAPELVCYLVRIADLAFGR